MVGNNQDFFSVYFQKLESFGYQLKKIFAGPDFFMFSMQDNLMLEISWILIIFWFWDLPPKGGLDFNFENSFLWD